MVVVIVAAVTAQIRDTNDKAIRIEDLRAEKAHAECLRVKRNRRQRGRSYALRIAQRPDADHRSGLRLACDAGLIQRRDGYRQSAVGLRSDDEVSGVAV